MIYNKLKTYCNSDYYAFHMPGHKRKMGNFQNPFSFDITEIEGFDDLHHPEKNGLFEKAQERAATLYKSEETHFLINGSTAGILSAISGCTKKGDCILVARNCHRSVYHGMILRDLKADWIYPQYEPTMGINGSILPEDVEKSLRKNSDIRAIILTSPTYEGVCSDIKKIVEIAHKRKIPVIVDQAHGAHFPFHASFPEDAISQGADLVIHSVHKTLPSLTQTALLHVQGDLVDRDFLNMYLSVYQTSSPSYILLASIDSCMDFLENRGQESFEEYWEMLNVFYKNCKELCSIHLMDENFYRSSNTIWDLDLSKILCSVKDTPWSGKYLSERLLQDAHIQMEMSTCTYSLGISTVADQKEGFERLEKALFCLDQELGEQLLQNAALKEMCFKEKILLSEMKAPETVISIGNAVELSKVNCVFQNSIGKISGAFVYLYPPGIPLLAPGERITEYILKQIDFWKQAGMDVQGLNADESLCVLE